LNDGVNAVGNSHSIESAYEMESELSERQTRRQRRRRVFWAVFFIAIGTLLTLLTGGLAIKKGIALMGVGGAFAVAGIALSSLAMLGAVWSIANSIAAIAEAFCGHGYNFMRDGVLGGNARLYRTLAWVAVGMMVVGGVGLGIAKGLKNVGVKKAQGVLKTKRKVIVIGENMQRVKREAKIHKAKFYKGMRNYEKFKVKHGQEAARAAGKAHNRTFILKKKRQGVEFIDIGPAGDVPISENYLMELELLENYFFHIRLW